MPTDLAFRLIEEVAGLGGEEVTFTGGEPLVDSRLSSLLSHATGFGLSTVVFTSGIVYGAEGPHCISKEQIAELVPVLNRVVVSVYSADALMHDAITQTAGSLAWTRQAIRLLVAKGVRVELHFSSHQHELSRSTSTCR